MPNSRSLVVCDLVYTNSAYTFQHSENAIIFSMTVRFGLST